MSCALGFSTSPPVCDKPYAASLVANVRANGFDGAFVLDVSDAGGGGGKGPEFRLVFRSASSRSESAVAVESVSSELSVVCGGGGGDKRPADSRRGGSGESGGDTILTRFFFFDRLLVTATADVSQKTLFPTFPSAQASMAY